jgi:hypothetical protein
VFEQFVQLDQSSTRRQGGTGLGLYLCRQLAALLNGTLVLEPAATGGCCFTLTISAAPAGAVADAPPPRADSPDSPPAPRLPGPPDAPEREKRFVSVRTRPAEFARRPATQPADLLPIE